MILKNFQTAFLSGNKFTNFLQGLKTVTAYFVFWLCYFQIFRGVFLLYHHSISFKLDAGLILGTFYHGLKMDISFSSYLCMMVLVILGLSILLSVKNTVDIISVVTLFFLTLISIISVADLELFREWGFRFDATPLMYLNTPMEMAASISASPYLMLLAAMVVTIYLGFRAYKTKIHPRLHKLVKPKLAGSMLYLILAAVMIIPVRGGLQLAPMNQSVAFFSNNDFANQAAINVPWNFFWSLGKQLYSRKNPYNFLDEKTAENLVKEFYSSNPYLPGDLLNSSKPNVIIILWESLTSRVISALGGNHTDVVPEFESLINEGILFNNFYANGNRSDKGIVAILSGYPAQPTRSIVKIPTKSSRLPVITESLNQNGYYTAYFHGGELEFANIKSYLVNAEFNTITGRNSFNKREMNSKWGAHDHVVLNKALGEISKQPAPFFNMIFTLSSHEPFDIPVALRFPGEDLESLYKSSLHYTDQSIGTFIREAKKQPWYENTLIIILADHGHRLLGDSPRYEKDRFHIPMLWLGGALSVQDSTISRTCSQTDIAKTLLEEIGIDAREFEWSRNIFNNSGSTGAFYVYNEGVGFIHPEKHLVYDYPSDDLLVRTEFISNRDIELCKAHLQITYQDYLNK